MKCKLLLLVILYSCRQSDIPATQSQATEKEILECSIDSLFQSYMDESEPGAAVLIAYDGQPIISKGYGVRDMRTQEPITPATNMRIASVSKQFTALGVLSLVDQGLVSLDDTVFKFLPFAAFQRVTIEQLINHTSGIANYDRYFDHWDKPRIAVNSDVLQFYASDPEPEFDPGTSYEYSNGAYILLAKLIETVSKMEFNEYMSLQVFIKAGMQRTNYFNLAQPVEIIERAFCYERDSTGFFKQVDGNILNGLVGDGGIYTNLNDYLNYINALRNKAIVSEEMHDLIFRPSSSYTYDDREIHYAMGWNIVDSFAVHSGSWYGTRTRSKHYLTIPLNVVIFMNRVDLFKTGIISQVDSLALDYVKRIRKQ